MYGKLELYSDGQWLNGDGRKGEDVSNPATEKPLAHLPHATTADLDRALEAAKNGLAVWRATAAYDRAKIMRKTADLVRERHDAISKTLVQEQGKAYPEARAEVLTSADIIDWYAEEGRRAYGRIVPGAGKGLRQIVTQEPVGLVAAFTRRRRPAPASRWCAASPTPACPRACSTSCSACRRIFPSTSSPRTTCARYR